MLPRSIRLAAALLVVTPLALAAQSPPDGDLAGRWVFWLDNGAPTAVKGELRLTQDGDSLGGALLIESRDAEPIVLTGGRVRGSEIEFAAELDGAARFTARLTGDRLRGSVAVDGTPAGRWSAERLQPGIEHYAALPRFTLRQIVTTRPAEVEIPGGWAEAASRLPERDYAGEYRALAERAGVPALAGGDLQQLAPVRLLGLARRRDIRPALERALLAIRDALDSDGARTRFDQIFRTRGGWIVDLHDAALAYARMRVRGLDWISARVAVADPGIRTADTALADRVPNAIYQLLLLREADSSRFAAERERMRRADRRSAAAVDLLIEGYDQAIVWHRRALALLLTERWVTTRADERPRSLAELVAAAWPLGGASAELPAFEPRLFAAPQAVPRYGVPRPLFDRIVETQNLAADEWLQRHGPAGLLATLRRLPADTSPMHLRAGTGFIRVTSVPWLARRSLNGFLEPRDAIAIDPAYPPVAALGAIVHEWGHLLLERERLTRLAAGVPAADTLPVVLPAVDPYLAEGFAEWSADRVLAPLADRWPMVLFGEWEKRARLVTHAESPHITGHSLVRALAAVRDSARVTELLARYGHAPAALAADPSLADAWPRTRRPARKLRSGWIHALVPQTTFTIEDRVPDLVHTVILAP